MSDSAALIIRLDGLLETVRHDADAPIPVRSSLLRLIRDSLAAASPPPSRARIDALLAAVDDAAREWAACRPYTLAYDAAFLAYPVAFNELRAELDRLFAARETGTPEMTCPCGEPLIRAGVVVKSHWRGLVCEDCERTMFEKHAARGVPS